MKNNIAFIGSLDQIAIFKVACCDVYEPQGQEDTRVVFSKLLSLYKIIFITNNYAQFVLDIIKDYSDKVYPLILVLPTSKNDSEGLLKQLDENVKKSLGISLTLQEGKND